MKWHLHCITASYLSQEVEISVQGLYFIWWNINNNQNRKPIHPTRMLFVDVIYVGFPNCYSDTGAITRSALAWRTNSYRKLQWKGIHGINNNISHFWVKWLLPNRGGNIVIYLRSREEKKLSNIAALWKWLSKPFQNRSTAAQGKICQNKGTHISLFISIYPSQFCPCPSFLFVCSFLMFYVLLSFPSPFP